MVTPSSDPIDIRNARPRLLNFDFSPEFSKPGMISEGWSDRIISRMKRRKAIARKSDGEAFPPTARVIGFDPASSSSILCASRTTRSSDSHSIISKLHMERNGENFSHLLRPKPLTSSCRPAQPDVADVLRSLVL